MPPQYGKPNKLNIKTFQKIRRTLAIFIEYGIIAQLHTMAKPMKTLELHYPMIHFLIKFNLHETPQTTPSAIVTKLAVRDQC